MGNFTPICVVQDAVNPLVLAADGGRIHRWAYVSGVPLPDIEVGAATVTAIGEVPKPGGRSMLAVAGDTGSVELWDPDTPSVVTPFTGHAGAVTAVCALPDVGGVRFASGGADGTVRVWEYGIAPRGAQLSWQGDTVLDLCALPDVAGRTLLAILADDGTVPLWDPAADIQAGTVALGDDVIIESMCALPGVAGRTLLACFVRDSPAYLWDPDTRAVAGRVPIGGPSVLASAAPRYDHRTMLAVCLDDRTEVWDPADGRKATDIRADGLGMAVVQDAQTLDRIVIAESSVRVTAWEAGRGTFIEEFRVLHNEVNALTADSAATGTVLVSGGGRLRRWHPAGPAELGTALIGHRSEVAALTTLHGGGETLLASVDGDGVILIWDLDSGAQAAPPITAPAPYPGTALCPVAVPGGADLLATCDNTEVRCHDARTGVVVQRLPHPEFVNAVCALPGEVNRVATACDDGRVRVWDTAAGSVLATLTGHRGAARSVCAGPSNSAGVILASGGNDATVRIWDWANQKEIATLSGHTHFVVALCSVKSGPYGYLIGSGSMDGSVRRWDPSAGTPIGEPLIEGAPVTAVCSVPDVDGRDLLAAAATDARIRLWDPGTGDQVGGPIEPR